MPPPQLALIDGNNCCCSCERVFQPWLQNRPLVVLSNNDGCAIARSDEAKALGIKMGAPWFKIRHLEDEAGLVALSANLQHLRRAARQARDPPVTNKSSPHPACR